MTHKVVPTEDWVAARKELPAREKEFSRLRDELSRRRRDLPWEKVEKEYVFDGPAGKETLADLFNGRSQLITYHFMFDPEWTEGCKSCSLIADHYDPSVVHLEHRDVSLVTVSRAFLPKLQAYRKRMGWNFKWVSAADLEKKQVYYNYTMQPFPVADGPGISVFYKDEAGTVFHTYSSFSRGLDMFITAYHLLDIVPKGRDEAGLPHSMQWLRHHDRY